MKRKEWYVLRSDLDIGVVFLPTYWVRSTLILVLFVATALFGLRYYPVHHFAALIWPASGIAASAAILWGYEYVLAVAVAALISTLLGGASVAVAIGIAVSTTAEAVFARYLLFYVVDFRPNFSHLYENVAFIAASIGSALVGAVLGTTTLLASGYILPSDVGYTLVSWWTGHALGILSVAPFLIFWGSQGAFRRTPAQWLEGVCGFTLLAVTIYFASWTPYTAIGPVSLIDVIILILIWAALRSWGRGTTLGIFMLSAIGLSGILFGHGPSAQGVSEKALASAQILIGTLDIIFLIIVAIVQERRDSLRALAGIVRNLEGELQQSHFEGQAKNEFIAILAHELRNPLSALLSMLELARADNQDFRYHNQIDTMASYVHTMARLLDDLLDVSRISQKKFKLHREPVEVRAIMQRSLQTADPYLTDRGHTVTCKLPRRPIWVLADPVRIEQIFVNLLNNAGKYTDPGGMVTVTLRQEGDFVVAIIKDTGIGIPPEKLPTIFDPLQRDDRMPRRLGGLGIGLSLTKRLVELHEGEIEAWSSGQGKGSTFTVKLPITRQMPLDGLQPESKRRVYSDRRPNAATYRVLVVDDNETAARGMAALLMRGGHKVEVCFDGPEVFSRVHEFEPHVVILDIGLPTMDGYEIARALKNNGTTAMLVALTGYGSEDDKRRAKESGFDHHLIKPVSVADVEAIIAQVPQNVR